MADSYSQHFKKIKNTKNLKAMAESPKSERARAIKKSSLDNESLLRQHFGLPVERKKGSKSKRKDLFSIPWTLVAMVGLVASILGYLSLFPQQSIDDLMNFLDRIEVSSMTGAQAADDSRVEKKSQPKSQKGKNVPPSEKGIEKEKAESSVSKDVSYLSKLSDRKRQLDLREQELNELEGELQRQQAVIEERIQRLEKMRSKIDEVLKVKVEEDEEKIGKLVEFYSNMKPVNAAKIIGEINEDLAIQILGRMKKKNAAAILDKLNPDKAQKLSEMYAGYQG